MAGRDVSASFSDPAHNSVISNSEFKEVVNEANRVKILIQNAISGIADITQEEVLVGITSDLDKTILLTEVIGDLSFAEYQTLHFVGVENG